jgi:hypothetical protein
MKDIKIFIDKIKFLKNDTEGKVGVPILMYFLGVPGFLVFFAWLFYFRSK